MQPASGVLLPELVRPGTASLLFSELKVPGRSLHSYSEETDRAARAAVAAFETAYGRKP